jgi:hypothetical protein
LLTDLQDNKKSSFIVGEVVLGAIFTSEYLDDVAESEKTSLVFCCVLFSPVSFVACYLSEG